MSEEELTTEVGKMVANGTVSPTKSGKDASEKKDGKRVLVEEMCEDTKDNVKDKNEDDKEDAEASEDGKEGERNEVKDSKEEGEDKRNEAAKSEPMEVDNLESANEQSEDKDKSQGVADLKEEEDKVEEIKETGPKKSATKKSGGEKGKNKKAAKEKNEEPKTPVGPTIERPIRERKSVERLVAVIERDTAKEFHIEKGRGTALKDIPNVAYKLLKKKVADDTLKLLHTVLFGRRGKALLVKSNVLQFSGFSWNENEEKPKAKVQEKLDKCNKEKLFEFCDLLDIPVTRTTAKKEDVIAKLIDFLLVPHATTSKLLAEKEQPSNGNKRKRPSKKIASPSVAKPSKSSSKKQKTQSASEDEKGTPDKEDTEEEEENNSEHQNVNGGTKKSESKEHASEPESGEDSKKRKCGSKKPSSKKESTPNTKPKKQVTPKKSSPPKETPTESNPSQSKSKDQSIPTTKTFSRKKKNKNNVIDEKPLTPMKSPSKEKTGRKDVKEKEKPKEEKRKPSDEELKTAICKILKEVDFNTATFTDILKLLNKRFKTELAPRKATIKLMIQEELTKIADEDDEGEPEKPVKEALAQKA